MFKLCISKETTFFLFYVDMNDMTCQHRWFSPGKSEEVNTSVFNRLNKSSDMREMGQKDHRLVPSVILSSSCCRPGFWGPNLICGSL